jgi:hypothetical protein
MKVSLHNRTLNRTTPQRVAQALLLVLSEAESPMLLGFSSLCPLRSDLCVLCVKSYLLPLSASFLFSPSKIPVIFLLTRTYSYQRHSAASLNVKKGRELSR